MATDREDEACDLMACEAIESLAMLCALNILFELGLLER